MGIIKINLAARFIEAGRLPTRIDERDRMELTEGAKAVFAAEKAKRLGSIRAKVKTDFYARPEVKEKVVEGLLRDLHNIGA